jgi:hypothetical protein
MAGNNDREFEDGAHPTDEALYRPPLYFILLFVTCSVLLAVTLL